MSGGLVGNTLTSRQAHTSDNQGRDYETEEGFVGPVDPARMETYDESTQRLDPNGLDSQSHWAQNALNLVNERHCFMDEHIAVDGAPGRGTRAAVRKFQEVAHTVVPGLAKLRVNGIIDAFTVDALERALGIPAPPSVLSPRQAKHAVGQNNASAVATDALPQFQSARRVPAAHQSSDGTYNLPLVQHVAALQQDVGQHAKGVGTLPKIDGVWSKSLLNLFGSMYDQQASEGQTNTTALWPRAGASMEEQYEHFSRISEAFGHTVTEGQPTIIALRGVMNYANETHTSKHLKAYDDSFILLVKTAEGVHVDVFSGATHAYQAASRASPNADGKGQSDVGSVRTNDGSKMYTINARGTFKGRESMHITADPKEWLGKEGDAKAKDISWNRGFVPVDRDTNQDRDMSDAEKTASATRRTKERDGQNQHRQVVNGMGDYGNGVYFHSGYTVTKKDGTNQKYSSIACQTARLEDVQRLRQASSGDSGVKYLLVDAAEAAARLNG